MNRYAYALNSPTSMFDPSGLMQQCAVQPDGSLYCWDDGTSNGGDPCNSDNEVCVNGSNGNSPTPTNPYPGGCVSSGTQGCISSTCASIYGCDGSPISGTSGTGGGGVSALGPPRTAVLSTSSKLLKYATFLGCEFNSDIEQLTDEEDAQHANQIPIVFSAIATVGGLTRKVPGWAGITGAVTGGIYTIGIAARSNIECTESVYGY